MSYKRINVEEARELIERGNAVVVDVRDPDSHRAGHIRGSLHIDNGNVQDFIERTDLGRPLIAYCYHGNMSQGAADYFNRNGFTTTYSMDGGYEAWESVDPKDASG